MHNVNIIDVKEPGVVAKLYVPELDAPRPAVVVLGGSDGGFFESAAKAFAQEGYVALALAYFNAPGLPKNHEETPLEYFLNAIHWLKTQPQVKAEQIHLYGLSKGGELAILLTSVFPDIATSVVAVVPSCATYGGFPNIQKSGWKLNNKPFPIAPEPEEKDELKQLETCSSVTLAEIFLEQLQTRNKEFSAAIIKVENIQCPLLLISGKDDKIWPSPFYCDIIMQRLDEHDSPIFRKHLSYENAGHEILPAQASICIGAQQLTATGAVGRYYEVGGQPKAQAEANKNSWEQIINFFANAPKYN